MKNKLVISFLLLISILLMGPSCSSTETYAEKLEKERRAIDRYLTYTGLPIQDLPGNGVFEKGIWYNLGKNTYMQVIDLPTSGQRAKKGDLVSFRFERADLLNEPPYSWAGNRNNPEDDRTQFYYDAGSTTYGTALELPLQYVDLGSTVIVVIPSKLGFTQEISAVTPFAYDITYIKLNE